MDKRVKIIKGNIVELDVDAIVNAAKPSLMGGGGVDGAIHKAAGIGLLEECKTIDINQNGYRCSPGDAKITKGYNLKAKYIIHTVGPVWRGGVSGEDKILTNSYINILKIAKENDIKSIAIPSISTGVYGYPFEEACKIALQTINNFLKTDESIQNIILVTFSDEDYKSYLDIYENYGEN